MKKGQKFTEKGVSAEQVEAAEEVQPMVEEIQPEAEPVTEPQEPEAAAKADKPVMVMVRAKKVEGGYRLEADDGTLFLDGVVKTSREALYKELLEKLAGKKVSGGVKIPAETIVTEQGC